MIKFDNLNDFERMLDSLPDDMHKGAVEGLHESLDDWLKRARPKAPKELGFLRSEMKTEIDAALLEGQLLSNAYSEGFNYAYYLHEVGSKKGYRPKRAGTSLTWLKDTMDEKRSLSIVEKHVSDHLRQKGW